MTIEEYVKACERTSRGLNTQEERYANYALGLCGEVTEVYELFKICDTMPGPKLLKEIGDVLWYLLRFASCLTNDYSIITLKRFSLFNFYENTTKQINVIRLSEMMVMNAGNIADIVKKGVFHRHELPKEEILIKLSYIYNLCELLLYCFGITIEEAMIANVTKLNLRYPNGFSTEDSLMKRDEY